MLDGIARLCPRDGHPPASCRHAFPANDSEQERTAPPEGSTTKLPLQYIGRTQLQPRLRISGRRKCTDDVPHESQRHYHAPLSTPLCHGIHLQRRTEYPSKAPTVFQERPLPHLRTIHLQKHARELLRRGLFYQQKLRTE